MLRNIENCSLPFLCFIRFLFCVPSGASGPFSSVFACFLCRFCVLFVSWCLCRPVLLDRFPLFSHAFFAVFVFYSFLGFRAVRCFWIVFLYFRALSQPFLCFTVDSYYKNSPYKKMGGKQNQKKIPKKIA